jgi:hypothetical protein
VVGPDVQQLLQEAPAENFEVRHVRLWVNKTAAAGFGLALCVTCKGAGLDRVGLRQLKGCCTDAAAPCDLCVGCEGCDTTPHAGCTLIPSLMRMSLMQYSTLAMVIHTMLK